MVIGAELNAALAETPEDEQDAEARHDESRAASTGDGRHGTEEATNDRA